MTVKLNTAGRAYAKALIAHGQVDRSSAWSFSADDGNSLLGKDGDDWTEYGRVHLAVDTAEGENTKARFKYPVIKGGKVYRRGVIAAKSRAAAEGQTDIEDAASALLEAIDKDQDDNKKSGLIAGGERRWFSELRTFKRDFVAGLDQGGNQGDPSLDAGGDDQQRDMGGYAAKYNVPTMIGSWFQETIAPGAFADAVANDDVRALFNHDPNYVIGRTASKTLTLSEDTTGLAWRATPPPTTWARDLAASIERGDISGCSFQFICEVDQWDYSGEVPCRTLIKCGLVDVSAVTFPAYEDTDVNNMAARTLDRARSRGQLPRIGPTDADLSRLARKRAQLDRLVRA